MQVNRHWRRLIHTHVATAIQLRQPHLHPHRHHSLRNLDLQAFTATTQLCLSHCLDWAQHPSLASLVDLSAVSSMTQLRVLNLRPSTDEIDAFEGDRVKIANGVLCWCNGVFPRLWDRWTYAISPGIPSIENLGALSALTNLQEMVFPITMRRSETPQPLRRLQAVATLSGLRHLNLGCGGVDDEQLSKLACASRLTCLSLGNCAGMGGPGLVAVGAMKRLQTLLLHGCAQAKLGGCWEALLPLSQLQTLALYGRPEGENVHFFEMQDSPAQAVPLQEPGGVPGKLCAACLCAMSLISRFSCTLCSHRACHSRKRADLRGACVQESVPCADLVSLFSMTQLGCLRIGPCGTISSAAWHSLVAMPQLSTLELFGGTVNCETPAVASIPSLKKLSLRHMRSKCHPVLATHGLRALQGLSLHCGPDNCATNTYACEQAESLQHLLMWGVHVLPVAGDTNAALHSNPVALSSLTRLTMSHEANDECVMAMAALPQLHTLELMSANDITNRAFEALSTVPTLKNLDVLNVPNIDDGGLQFLTARAQLLTLRMKGSQITDAGVAAMSHWPDLRNLSIARAARITSDSLVALSRSPALKILDLGGCAGLIDDGLEALAQLRELRQLNLERCRNISNEGIEAFKRRLLAAGPLPPGPPPPACVVVFF